jgi:hypothetical protein
MGSARDSDWKSVVAQSATNATIATGFSRCRRTLFFCWLSGGDRSRLIDVRAALQFLIGR